MAFGTPGIYDPRLVNVYLAGIEVDTFADGSFVDIDYTSDKNRVATGAKGDQTYVKINNGGGTCTLRLKQNSQMHALLTIAMNIDDATAGGTPPLPFSAMQGSTPLALAMYKIGKAPKRTFPGSANGQDEPICEWTLALTNLRILS